MNVRLIDKSVFSKVGVFLLIPLILLFTIGVLNVYAAPLDVVINQSSTQVDPTTAANIRFTAVFSQPINVSTFDASDMVVTGTASGKTVTSINELAPNDGTTFEITISTSGPGTVTVSIPLGSSSSVLFGTTGSAPYAITIDSLGNLYTANYTSNNVTKITPAGVSSILGTTGSNPQGIVVDNLGNVYTENYTSEDVTKISSVGILDLTNVNLNTASVSTDNTVTRIVGYSVYPTSITVGENLGTGTFNVVLSTQPASDVVIAVTSSSLPDATVSPAVLTFTNVNWNVPQLVTVTGVDDSIVSSDTAIVTTSIVPGLSDDSFDLLTSQAVNVTLSNDDVPPPAPIISGGGGAVLTLDALRSLNRNTPPQTTAEIKLGEPNVPPEFAQYVCKRYLKSYIYPNKNNNADDVKKLQIFLNTTQGANLAVDGVYKIVDIDAVKRYQLKYTDQILAPLGLA